MALVLSLGYQTLAVLTFVIVIDDNPLGLVKKKKKKFDKRPPPYL